MATPESREIDRVNRVLEQGRYDAGSIDPGLPAALAASESSEVFV
jgi:hypothetical protein